MKKLFAVPTAGGKLTAHFGHCEKFAVVEVDGSAIVGSEFIEPPVHQPGVYPRFLADSGVSTIIAGGMGQKAQDLFKEAGIEVCIGIEAAEPENLVRRYLDESLTTGTNQCDH